VRNKTSPVASPVEGEAEVERLSIAFKAIRGDMIRDLESTRPEIRISCRQQVEQIIEHLRQGCEDVGSTDGSDTTFVRAEPIVSLAEAKAQVGLIDRLNYELKVGSLAFDVLPEAMLILLAAHDLAIRHLKNAI
jgi:hypothetical protein